MYPKDALLSFDKSSNSPHTIIPDIIQPNSLVLDVGCNTGYLAKVLLDSNSVTDCIDINEKALQIAKKYCRKIFKRDLYKNSLNIPKIEYDYVVFADILEHIPRPDLILKDTNKYLKNTGTIIISLPNIARLEIRLKLLIGKFDYAQGILSPDHLRFYTKTSAIHLINMCGLKVTEIIPTGFAHRFPFLTTLTAFQFIYVSKKK